MFKKINIFLLLLLSFLFVSNALAGTSGNISGDVSLKLKEETISAKLKYDYVATGENESVIKFYLSETFSVSKVKCNICLNYDFDKTGRPTLSVKLSKPIKKGERLKIEFEYGGKLGETYNSKEQFLELGLDFFWIPYDTTISDFTFNYKLNIKTDSPDFQMVSNGATRRKGADWLIESKQNDIDINVIFAKNLEFKTYKEKGYSLQLVSRGLPAEVSEGLLKGMVETLDFYNSTFGKSNPQKAITAVFRPFEMQLGYFRKGFFILPSPKTADELFSSISHELAHFWWSRADLQNDWLDESFAEYSAMLALRKLRGTEKFNTGIERKKKLNVNLPPIYGFDRTKNRQQTPMVLYVKGPLKLYELEQELGEEKFLQFLQIFEEQRITETDKLIEALRKFVSNEVADKFLANLKN